MTCEKQFLPPNNTYLYCSEACRLHDEVPPTQPLRTNSYPSYVPTSPPLTPYTRQHSSWSAAVTPSHEDGPDIVPRFSPTQSRPRSYFNSEPYPQSYQAQANYSSSPPQTYNNSGSSTALASLRELATALPRTGNSRREPESPPKSSSSSVNHTSSGVWNYIPFTSSSKSTTPTPSATPGNSYTSHTYTASQSYGNGHGYAASGYSGKSREDLYSYGKSHGTAVGGYGNTGGMGMDRPLPPRSGPGGYGHRPKSIDLVTPFSNHH